jgi:hypothetical protein
LPSIGLEMTAPDRVEVTPVGNGHAVVRCCEKRADGKTMGELEVSMFKAALIIDRDGILEQKAREVAEDGSQNVAGTVAVSLPGASGYRADVEPQGKGSLPYVHVFAMAPHDLGIDGGVVVVVRSAKPDWPAAELILSSLRLLPRNGRSPPANDEEHHDPMMPIVEK